MKAVTQPAVAVVEADAEEGGHHRVAHGGVDEEDDEEGEILPPLAHLRDGVCAELPPRAPLRPRGDEHEQRDEPEDFEPVWAGREGLRCLTAALW